MHKISFNDPHRQKHFDFFRKMDQPHFNICVQLDITATLKQIKEAHLHFTSTIVYLVAKTANTIPSFKQRIQGEEVVEYDRVHPSFTVQTEASDVFSFCFVPYQPDFKAFAKLAAANILKMQQTPSFEDEAGRDDLLFLSAFPWASFTGLTHAMHYSPVDSVPRITWGKFYTQGERTLLPLSIQAHHALVDGKHVGLYCQQFEAFMADPTRWMD